MNDMWISGFDVILFKILWQCEMFGSLMLLKMDTRTSVLKCVPFGCKDFNYLYRKACIGKYRKNRFILQYCGKEKEVSSYQKKN